MKKDSISKFGFGIFWDESDRFIYICPFPGITFRVPYRKANVDKIIVDQMQLPAVGEFGEKLNGLIDWMEENNLEWESAKDEHLILKKQLLVAPGQWIGLTINDEIFINSKPFEYGKEYH